MLKDMAQMVTDAIYAIKLEWKESSLEFLQGGSAINVSSPCSMTTPSGAELQIKRVDVLEVLGVALDGAGSTVTSIDHRLAKADGCVWANGKAFKCDGTVREKLQAWQLALLACATFGAESWSITQHTLQRLRSWELGHLRRILKLRRRPDEGPFLYNTRTAMLVDKWREKLGIEHVVHKVLKLVFKAAWLEKCPKGSKKLNLIEPVRSFRDSSWWALMRNQPYKRRKHEGLVQWKPGLTPSFDDIFVSVLGPGWRSHRDASDRAAWKKCSAECIKNICEWWGFFGCPG